MHSPDPITAPSAVGFPGGRYEAVRTDQGVVILDRTTGQYAIVQDTGMAASTPATPPFPTTAPAPVAAPVRPGLGVGERRILVVTGAGAVLLLAGGGAVLMAGHGVAAAGPELHDVTHLVEWLVFLVGVAVFGLLVVLGRRRAGRGGPVTVHEEHHYHTESHGFLSRATTNVRE